MGAAHGTALLIRAYAAYLIPFYSTQAEIRSCGILGGQKSDLHHASELACDAH